MSDDIHEVFAVAYASHGRMRSENYIFGDPHDEMTSITYYVWVIKGPHGVFVVDTGFDDAAAKERGRTIVHPVGEGLKALGVDPAEVKNVIATHMHWDHAGNYDLFPKARYHIQDEEMAYSTGRCMCHKMLRIPFSESDVHAMVGKVFADRCEFHDGPDELAPGITVHKIGGHSKGLRLRHGRVRLHPSLFAYRRGPRVSDHLFGRRNAGRLQDDPEARDLAPAHRAGP
jgi:glyoxylase-like metal-dependent hydrolase (beta-lactamase superfamily II)